MTRDEAIRWYREIQGGAGVDRYDTPVLEQRGSVAVGLWDDPAFTLGVEYGALIALARAFDIERPTDGADA